MVPSRSRSCDLGRWLRHSTFQPQHGRSAATGCTDSVVLIKYFASIIIWVCCLNDLMSSFQGRPHTRIWDILTFNTTCFSTVQVLQGVSTHKYILPIHKYIPLLLQCKHIFNVWITSDTWVLYTILHYIMYRIVVVAVVVFFAVVMLL